MSVRSSVFESLTAIAAVTRSNVISRYTSETDTDSICSMVHHTDTVVAIVALLALLAKFSQQAGLSDRKWRTQRQVLRPPMVA